MSLKSLLSVEKLFESSLEERNLEFSLLLVCKGMRVNSLISMRYDGWLGETRKIEDEKKYNPIYKKQIE